MTTLALQVGRLTFGAVDTAITEQVGDPVASLGGAVVPAPRTAPAFQIALATLVGAGTSLGKAQSLRRQLRALLNNTPVKLQGFLYVVYADDPEQNGWYVPAQATLAPKDGTSWQSGLWTTQQADWYLVGHRRTHREARQVWMKDLRTGLFERDFRGWLISTDFSALPALALSVLPNGASAAINTVSGAVLSGPPLPAGRDGGVCQVVQGLADLTVVSYERPESALNLSDVICYDRTGQVTAPTAGPDTSWQEVPGPDWPWSWQTAGQPQDAPVLDNGLIRVRYDGSNTPGFRVDVWNGSAYVEQGKLTVYRLGDVQGFCNTWVSAALVEWTPERAVASVVLSNSADANSREQVYVTVQRGELGVTFECYPALKAAGTQADTVLGWQPALNAGAADVNDSAFKSDTQTLPAAAGTGVIKATAGSGSSSFGAAAALGAASFATSENFAALLRCPTAYNVVGPYQVTLAVVQAANAYAQTNNYANSYGVGDNALNVVSQNGAGYLQAQLAFSATVAQQVMEAEAMTLGAGTASTADAASSGGTATTATRTTDANPHVSQATWPNSFQATYRVFARVKTSASTLNIYAKTGATTGATVTTVSGAYVWLDLGEVVANNSTLEIHCWASAAATVWVDRVESFLLTDRARTAAILSGCRDQGQAALNSSFQLGAVVAR